MARTLLQQLSATAACLLPFASLHAQCDFDPTIDPAAPILCPEEQAVLSTQVYDSYQWYKNGQPINGATDQTHVVTAFNDAGYSFSVEATLNGCTEMSPEILVDGWVFLPPFVMTVAPEPLFFTQNGPVYCGSDSVLLVLMLPYDTNIQWSNNGTPIPGATDDTLVVTEAGNYHVIGAPSICPNFMQQLGVGIPIAFLEPIQPVIMMGDASICVTPEGVACQWYFNGAPVAGDSPCIVPEVAGVYTVEVTYEPDCSLPAEPMIITGVDEDLRGIVPNISPMPAQDAFTITGATGRGIGAWFMLDATGRVVLQGNELGRSTARVDVRALQPGAYWMRVDGYAAAPVSIVR